MKQKAAPVKQPAEDVIRDIRRATRRHFLLKRKSALFSMACAARRRAIRGRASFEEARALLEDGIEIFPLPGGAREGH